MLTTTQKSMVLAAALLPSFASGAEIRSGSLDESRGVITLDVIYSGGCKKHDFELDLQLCRESFPVQCEAKLVDKTTDDYCEALVARQVTFSLKDEGLLDKYYSGGSLRITGDAQSSVTLTLPQ